MAKKPEKKVQATQPEKATRPVRLELKIADVERLERCAQARGLNNASYARMAVLKLIKEDEEG